MRSLVIDCPSRSNRPDRRYVVAPYRLSQDDTAVAGWPGWGHPFLQSGERDREVAPAVQKS
jgi:hypothetical protein